jgi:hypothetical protein
MTLTIALPWVSACEKFYTGSILVRSMSYFPMHCRSNLARYQRVLCSLACVTIAGGAPQPADAAGYTFTDVSSNGSFFPYYSIPSINNLGTVAFIANVLADGKLLTKVLAWNDGAITEIASSDGLVFTRIGGAGPVINDKGRVVFRGVSRTEGVGIFTGKGGPTRAVVLRSQTVGGLGNVVSINSAGVVSFVANFRGDGVGIYSGSHGIITEIAWRHDATLTRASLSINAAGMVAFYSARRGIFASDGDSKTTIARLDNVTQTYRFVGDAAINDAGTVAFVAPVQHQGDFVQRGIFFGNGEEVTAVAFADYKSNTFTSFDGSVSINSAGKVAFAAYSSGGGPYTGIFTGPDPIVDKVIGPQETLFGSPTNGVGIANHALNDAGQIAFWYSLEDGRLGVALGTPLP